MPLSGANEIANASKLTSQSAVGASTKERRSAAKRTAILSAARTIFAQRGFNDTMVEDIAEEAGIGKGTIYLYFDSKQKIFLDILLDDCQQMSHASKHVMSEDKLTWQDRVESFIQVRLSYCEQHPDFMRILLTEVNAMFLQNRPVDPRLATLVHEAEHQLRQMFAVAKAQKKIAVNDPQVPATTVIALMRGLIEQRLKGGTEADVQRQLQFSLEMLSRALTTK